MLLLLVSALYWAFPKDTPEHPAFVNPYDPALGGINCDDNCANLANGYIWTEEDYGRLAACPPRFMGCSVSFENDYDDLGPLLCYDTGGAHQAPRYVDKFNETVEYFDVLWDLSTEDGTMIPREQLPWWNHALFYDWRADCSDADH